MGKGFCTGKEPILDFESGVDESVKEEGENEDKRESNGKEGNQRMY